MRFSRFFIDRPILAGVLSMVVFLAGAIAMFALPISEYPEVVPPSIVVRAVYPGANPRALAEAVSTPLEEQINGVENMLYMSSQATSDGVVTLTVTFRIGTDPDVAQVQVQNRVSQALPRLPEEVRQFGVTTIKSSPDLTMVVHIVSPDNRYDITYLRNYATLQVRDALARVKGVGQAPIFGSGDYAMRIWLDPAKVAARGLSAGAVVAAIREQNVQVAAGVVGAPPMPNNEIAYQLSVNARGRLVNEEEFGDIIVKTGTSGELTRLRDVARIELGAGEYALRSLLDNKPAVAIPIYQAPGSNALQLSTDVRATLKELSKNFPEGVEYSVVYDPTTFVRDSIREVIITLLEATLLVVVVVVLFLQTWRASIIPLLAVPVSIVGTLAFMLAFGFSINTLSLFGLVLAVGIVVDDAIVVVENVERNIALGMTPREASYQAMHEVSGPIIAIALVLCAVFVPIAFISGLTGQFYRQFALTIAFSTLISAFNSLTLSPALSALLLKPHGAKPDGLTRLIERAFGWLFRPFNRFFASASDGYGRVVNRVIRRSGIALTMYAGLLALTAFGFAKVPRGFVPTQDKGYLVAFAQLPDAATLDRTESVIKRMGEIGLRHHGVKNAIQFPGLSINGFVNAPNAGVIFFGLKDFKDREGAHASGAEIAADLNRDFGAVQDGIVAVFPPPPVSGIGSIGGFKMELEDRGALGEVEMNNAVQSLLAKAYETPELAGMFSGYQISVPQLSVDVDREKVKRQGLALTDVFQTLQVYLGSSYVNDFTRFGRTYRVVAQADAPFRATADGIGQFEVPNARGEMVPLSSVISVRPTNGPDRVVRHNAYPAAELNGGPAPGVSSGEAVAAMERIARETLPNGIGFDWTELTYQQTLAGNTSLLIFPLCVLLAFLVLAAQYESWSLPLAVILIVPMGLLSAIGGVWLSKGDNNVFTQIGLIVLIGLACKNAILIVEFARELEAQGRDRLSAALEACRLRLRPILMTSLAFIMGVVPLVLSTGAGSEMRHAMGVAVFSGMLGVTLFGLVLTPVFYVAIRRLVGQKSAASTSEQAAGTIGGVPAPVLTTAALLVVLALGAAAPTLHAQGRSPDLKRADEAGLVPFWRQLGDTTLERLTHDALIANNDVRASRAGVRLARSGRRIAALDFVPRITASTGMTSRRFSATQVPGLPAANRELDVYDAGLDASWEVDLSGRLRGKFEAQDALAVSADEDLRDMQLSLVSELARTYFELRGAQRRLQVANRNAANQQRTLQITIDRLAAGRGTAFDRERASAQVSTTLAGVAATEAQIVAATNRIGMLVGRTQSIAAPPADGTDADLGLESVATSADHSMLPEVPTLESVSKLLRRRPDVRSAERRAAAEETMVSVARADYLPRLSVVGTVGFNAGAADGLGKREASRYAIGPVISWAAFDLGRVRAQVNGARAQQDAARARYEQTVLRAELEVSSAITLYESTRTRVVLLRRAAQSSEHGAELARLRLNAGESGFLEVLDAQRSLLDAQDRLAQGETDAATAFVALYRALGGAWSPSAVR